LFLAYYSLSKAVQVCPRRAWNYNAESQTRPLSFDFTLSFIIRQLCIHSWFY